MCLLIQDTYCVGVRQAVQDLKAAASGPAFGRRVLGGLGFYARRVNAPVPVAPDHDCAGYHSVRLTTAWARTRQRVCGRANIFPPDTVPG